jgi:hypothetical protein
MENRLFKVVNKTTTEMHNEPFRFEHTLQEFIVEHPSVLTLSDTMKEVEISWVEKKEKGRRYDIVAHFNDSGDTAVVELKRNKIDERALKQIKNYMSARTQEKFDCGILVGSSISPKTLDAIRKSRIELYVILLNCFDFGEIENVSTIIYAPKETERDYTKYTLYDPSTNSSITNLSKGKLVYEIIKEYVSSHPLKTIEELQKEFPIELANRGLEAKLQIIIKNDLGEDDKLRIRYFKDPLTCADGEILICNQWGIGNIQGMIDKAKELGMKVTSLNKQ